MTAIEDARAALAEFYAAPMAANAGAMVAARLRALIAEHERTVREMHARELHHFETEKAITEALAAVEVGDRPDALRILKAALGPARERLTAPPTDYEREALAQFADAALEAARNAS